jgi:Fe2+ or Zn2+ uptake regulation protein
MSSVGDQVRRRLDERGARYTPHRRAVVAALSDADGPRSASELFTDLDEAVPLSSLYRSLAVMEGAGVLTPHLGAREVIRYELSEWLSGHHHHLVCMDCGSVEDVDVPAPVESEVRTLVAGIAGKSFTPLGHTLEIEGRCARCA